MREVCSAIGALKIELVRSWDNYSHLLNNPTFPNPRQLIQELGVVHSIILEKYNQHESLFIP